MDMSCFLKVLGFNAHNSMTHSGATQERMNCFPFSLSLFWFLPQTKQLFLLCTARKSSRAAWLELESFGHSWVRGTGRDGPLEQEHPMGGVCRGAGVERGTQTEGRKITLPRNTSWGLCCSRYNVQNDFLQPWKN